MPAAPKLIAHARDLFADIGQITVGGLFGGSALYAEGNVMFAMGYWILPNVALEDPGLASEWGKKALAAL
jgi:TfoX/Sxy family transcriptional regulator of competence genes